jgi:hypothetical protein
VASYSGQSPLWRFATLHYPPPQKEKGKGNSVAFYFLQKNEDEVFTKKRQNLITGKVWFRHENGLSISARIKRLKTESQCQLVLEYCGMM